jgi:hypothetical protein
MWKYLFFLFIIVSCNPSQKATNNLEQLNEFVMGVESGGSSFTESDWIEADSTFNGYITIFDKSQYNLLNIEEREKYNRLIGIYKGTKAVYLSQKFLKDVKQEIVDFGNKARGFTESVIRTIDSGMLKKN